MLHDTLGGELIPHTIRDAFSNFIARCRYGCFGKGDACSLPSEHCIFSQCLAGTAENVDLGVSLPLLL